VPALRRGATALRRPAPPATRNGHAQRPRELTFYRDRTYLVREITTLGRFTDEGVLTQHGESDTKIGGVGLQIIGLALA
jgi:hypothetical protein